MSDGIVTEKDVFVEDAKIIIDIQSIAERYGSFKDLHLQICSTDKDFIDFSFKFGTILFSEHDIDFIKKYVKEMGYEYLHFLIHSSGEFEPIYLGIRMQVSSKKRKMKDLLKWIYYLPERIYWRYRYWRNYGTWRY